MHPSIQIEDTSHHVYLADFGLSQLMVDTRTLGTQTCQQGTSSFQSHEQLTAMDVGTEADIYAFGCLAVELFGGKPVWEGLHPYQIITKVVVHREKPNILGISIPNSIHYARHVCLTRMTGSAPVRHYKLY